LEDRRKLALEELRAYGDVDASGSITDFDVDEGSFAEIARQYGGLARELETVKREIAHLEE
jgi:diphthamide biosynthesis protein 3